jgi:hypothetical protein
LDLLVSIMTGKSEISKKKLRNFTVLGEDNKSELPIRARILLLCSLTSNTLAATNIQVSTAVLVELLQSITAVAPTEDPTGRLKLVGTPKVGILCAFFAVCDPVVK